MSKTKRNEIADYWDDAVKEWLDINDGDWLKRLQGQNGKDDLARWFSSYVGAGDGAINLNHGLEAYAGDLRGNRSEPRIVTLALNPGVGYDELQCRDGVWSTRIAIEGYSNCFKRSPPADPSAWLKVHGKTSHFWDLLTLFAQRWLADPKANFSDILNFELYPWHSRSKTAGISTANDLVLRYIFEPVAEVDVSHVFAFGADWFEVARNLRLKELRREVLDAKAAWEVGLYQLPSKQGLVVSKQSGYAGPPGKQRVEIFRQFVGA